MASEKTNTIKRSVLFLILAILLTSACDNNADLYSRSSDRYTLYGVLDMKKDSNFIRIKDINVPIIPDSNKQFRGEVAMTNLTSGQTEILKNRKVVFEGITTHNFYSAIPLLEANTYLIEVSRDGEVITDAVTTTPTIADYEIGPEMPNCTTRVSMTVDPVLDSELFTMDIRVFYEGYEDLFVRSLSFQERSEDELIISFTPRQVLNQISLKYSPILEDAAVDCYKLDEEFFVMEYVHADGEIFFDRQFEEIPVTADFNVFGSLYDSTFVFQIDTTNLNPGF